MSDALAIVRRRLVAQRLAGAPWASAAAAVGALGAVQAQEFGEAKWSLAERVAGCRDADVEAAFARGDIVRTHVLRPTWHLVAARDLRWLLRLSRPRVHALNRYWYGRLELDGALLARAHDVLARALAEHDAATRPELAARLAADGIEAAGQRLAYVLMHAELEGLICSGPRRGRQHTYALVDRRVPPGELDALHGDAALDRLVLAYFDSHGPATDRDFATWASMTLADTRAALDRVAAQLHVEQRASATWYATRAPPAAVRERLGGAFLIPMYDELVVAYRTNRVVLAGPPPRGGLLARAIVVDGRTVGSWRRALGRGAVVVEATLFAELGAAERAALDAAAERFGRALGLAAVVDAALA